MDKSIKKKNPYKFFTVFLVIVVAAMGIYFFLPRETGEAVANVFTLPEVSTSGFVQVTPNAQVVGDTGVVTLTGNCYQVTANTEVSQAVSVANGLLGKIDVRPNTHDLMKSAFQNLGINVVMLKIVDLRNSTYFGKLIIKQGNNVLSLDTRPSDGIALAVRMGAPIYLNQELLLKNGLNVCSQ